MARYGNYAKGFCLIDLEQAYGTQALLNAIDEAFCANDAEKYGDWLSNLRRNSFAGNEKQRNLRYVGTTLSPCKYAKEVARRRRKIAQELLKKGIRG